MLGVLYAGLGLLFLPFFAIAGLVGAFLQHAEQGQNGSIALTAGLVFITGLFFPIFYGMMGFIFGVITAAIYNVVAHWVGGIEVEVE